jgi:hypothetical protein
MTRFFSAADVTIAAESFSMFRGAGRTPTLFG